MFHTRPGAYFSTGPSPVRVHSRTWPALEFRIEDVQTDVDRPWWVILFGEVIVGLLTAGLSILYIEGLVSAAASSFRGRSKPRNRGTCSAGPPDDPAARRHRRSDRPRPVRDHRVRGVRWHLRVGEAFARGAVWAHDGASHIPRRRPALYLAAAVGRCRERPRAPHSVGARGPHEQRRAAGCGWTRRRAAAVRVLARVLHRGRLRRHRSAVSPVGRDGVRCRNPVGESAHAARVAADRLRSLAQLGMEPADHRRRGDRHLVIPRPCVGERYSEWHRVDAPCRAVNPHPDMRPEVEHADRLPFSLRLLENHRKGLCPYCFFGGPAGINANL